jgi:hypothetical protein
VIYLLISFCCHLGWYVSILSGSSEELEDSGYDIHPDQIHGSLNHSPEVPKNEANSLAADMGVFSSVNPNIEEKVERVKYDAVLKEGRLFEKRCLSLEEVCTLFLKFLSLMPLL